MQTNKECQTTPEEKGAKFLQWIADNEKEMRKALRKNCTFDAEIFDDVFGEAIINVHSTIVKNDREIDNIKNYFFLALKWQYQMRQNQHRKHRENAVRDYWQNHTIIDTNEDVEAKDNDLSNALSIIREVLTDEFGEQMTTIFLTYWENRSNNVGSYQTLADKFGVDCSEKFKATLQQMRSFVVEEMGYLREIFTTDYEKDC